jgi:hypothetical protein
MENKEELLLEGEIATRSHIKDVNALLILAAQELLSRAIVHDSSKLGPEEREKFSLAAAMFKEQGNEFGTDGYVATKEWLGEALKHHYMHNSHHPEHYPEGVMGMNLFDLLEMLLDWSAASAARSEKGLMDLEKSQEIHNIPRDLMIILENTAEFLQLNHVEDC